MWIYVSVIELFHGEMEWFLFLFLVNDKTAFVREIGRKMNMAFLNFS